MTTIIIRVVGVVLLSVGFVVFWLPIPIGAIMMAVGGLILFGKHPRWISFVQNRRAGNPWFNRLLCRLERISPASIQQTLVESQPESTE